MNVKWASAAVMAFFLLGLVSCASPITPVPSQGPNGRDAYTMRCGGGMGRTLEMCRQKAGELCPNGYNIIEQKTSSVVVPINGSMTIQDDELTIECR